MTKLVSPAGSSANVQDQELVRKLLNTGWKEVEHPSRRAGRPKLQPVEDIESSEE